MLTALEIASTLAQSAIGKTPVQNQTQYFKLMPFAVANRRLSASAEEASILLLSKNRTRFCRDLATLRTQRAPSAKAFLPDFAGKRQFDGYFKKTLERKRRARF